MSEIQRPKVALVEYRLYQISKLGLFLKVDDAYLETNLGGFVLPILITRNVGGFVLPTMMISCVVMWLLMSLESVLHCM